MKIKINNMKKILFLLLFFPFLFASCVDEDETLGIDLVDSSDLLQVGTYTDVQMGAKFYREDSLLTANYRYNTLGEYHDTKFGTIKSSIYTQLHLSMAQANFAGYDQIDSVVFTLAYANGFSEDTALSGKTMHLEIFELSEVMDTTKKYSFDEVATDPQPIFSEDVLIDYNSDVVSGTDTLDPRLSVRIQGGFVDKLKNFSGTNEDFIAQFKGLKFVLSKKDASGAIAYIDMTSATSCITVHYTQSSKAQKYLLKFPSEGHRFMHYDYDFAGSDIASLANGDTLSGDDLIYLGNMGISMAKINIEDFRADWKDNINGGKPNNNVAINSALLEIPVSELSLMNNPNNTSRILCYRRHINDNDTSLVLIHDAQVSDAAYDGYYDTKTKSFKLRITMHLENYLNGNITDPNVYLIPDARRSSATRVILCGPKNQTSPARIKIVYSKNQF